MTERNSAEGEHRLQNLRRGLSRRRLLEWALAGAAAVAAGVGLDRFLNNPNTPKKKEVQSTLLGGEWVYPDQGATIPTQAVFAAHAYPTSSDGSDISHVTFTINPEHLKTPVFNPNDPEQGYWVILGKVDHADTDGIYRLKVDLGKLGAEVGTEQTVSFDVHGFDSQQNPIVNEAPNGEHTIKVN